MSKAPVQIMESILDVSSIYLFGREISDLTIAGKDDVQDDFRLKRRGKNNFLRDQLRNGEASLARIYAFSFEGCLYELTRPSLFIVHGPGEDPDLPDPGGDYSRLARSPGRLSRTGVGRQSGSFSMDVKVWVYDKADLSMRLDIETGSFEHLLLDAELDDDMRDSNGRSGSGRSGSGRSGSGRSGSGRSGSGRSGSGMGRSGS